LAVKTTTRGLIFDFDGLILDTEVPEFQAWQEIYREHGHDLALEKWGAVVGTSPEVFDVCVHLEELIGRAVSREALHMRHKQRTMAMIHAQPVLPGVEDVIIQAQELGLKLGVASTSSCDWVTGHLARLGLLDHFDAIRGADDVENVKPAPDLYLAALDALDLTPDEAVAFEDSAHGAWAAKRAGIFTVVVPNAVTSQLDLDHADMRLESLAAQPLTDLLVVIEQRKTAR
jgi:HAD superfamily hydrolase (TIGR01509 family)